MTATTFDPTTGPVYAAELYEAEVTRTMETVLHRHRKVRLFDYQRSDTIAVTELPLYAAMSLSYWYNAAAMRGVCLAMKLINDQRTLVNTLRREADGA